MERHFEELARRRRIALDASFACGCACLVSLGRMTELNLIVARAAIDGTSIGARRLLAAQSAIAAALYLR